VTFKLSLEVHTHPSNSAINVKLTRHTLLLSKQAIHHEIAGPVRIDNHARIKLGNDSEVKEVPWAPGRTSKSRGGDEA
jgi:hypothetical protein